MIKTIAYLACISGKLQTMSEIEAQEIIHQACSRQMLNSKYIIFVSQEQGSFISIFDSPRAITKSHTVLGSIKLLEI